MRLYFRPFPGLTAFTIVSLIILIGLGTWQYQRLQWKTQLLAEVEQAVSAPALTSLSAVERALEAGKPVDFRRIELDARVIPDQVPYLVYSREKMTLSWRPYVAVEADGRAVFAARTSIPDTQRGNVKPTMTEEVSLAGYVRLWRPKDRGVADSTPSANRWFGFNPLPDSDDWGASVPGGADTRYYIDVEAGAISADSLPTKRPNIRNNHFDYMLTWYGLAVALFVIYLILHVQRGRLSVRGRP